MHNQWAKQKRRKKVQKDNSFVYRLMQSTAHNMRGVLAKDSTGREAYYYIMVDNHKIPAFEKALGTGSLKLTDYGKIIASGYGKPSTETKQKMLDEYGFKTDSE